MSPQDFDQILLPLLGKDQKEREEYLSELITQHAEPVIQKIVRSHLKVPKNILSTKDSWDAEDLCGNALSRLMFKLTKFSQNPENQPIRDFLQYTAVVAHHVCNQYFRSKYPKRSQLKNKLRYTLTHYPSFGLWKDQDQLVCGLKGWRKVPPCSDLQELKNHTSRLRENYPANLERRTVSIMLYKLFHSIGKPFLLNDLVIVMVEAFEIREDRRVEETDLEKGNVLDRIEDQRSNTATKLEHGVYLKHLWNEIVELPQMQRTALMLGIRDSKGGSVLNLFPLMEIASIPAVAACLAISKEDLAVLWNRLPLDDNEISGRLGITRQQVINLRRAARDRLARRMKQF